ncbi:LacI family DNA-binding transcriptional regulator [Rhodohalobacter sp. 614A]|uniref:LacI family DNA-binding transcriptional regulator n=1 Tax=Rhodohalobacter sp. 614A TaxID=2908649 RepID=UPI001F1A2802|nr:LacI family DNA-binding transcriptional regulator [Rhodohalobacter sp. 614A]
MSVKEIAKAAGVSTATVSRVLNGSDKVRKSTAKRVMKVVDEMNYRMNHVARRMKVKQTDSLVIGLVITDIDNPFFSSIAKGVEDVASKNKLVTMICNTNENPEKERFFLNAMLSEKVSGVIIVPTTGNLDFFKELVDDGFPMVMVDRKLKGLKIDSVSLNNKKGAYEAVNRLIQNGHRRIGVVAGIKGLSNTQERLFGYREALKESGIEVDNDLIFYGDYIEAGGRMAIEKFMSLKNPPTAVFSTNNLMTLGCVKEIYRQELTIPDDLAIIAFDDSVWSEALIPPLTTVKQPGFELGVNAAELLIKRLSNGDSNRVDVVLNPELVIRGSCGSNVG